MKIIWFEEAWEDYIHWQTQDKKLLNASTNFFKTPHETATQASENQSH